MICDIYPLLSILWWSLLAQWMKFVYTRGYNEWWTYQLLPRFSKGAPTWFTCGWAWAALWDDNLFNCDASGRKCIPNPAFYLHFRSVARDRFSDWVAKAADNVARPLVNAVSNLLGSLLHGYLTFSTWIEVVWTRLGTYVPSWASSLSHAAVKLYHWFPTAIVKGWKSWEDIWAEIKSEVWSWVLARFDAARDWVANHAPWVIDWINFLGTWYNAVGVWVTSFKNDPYGTVAGWLGLAWVFLSGSYTGLQHFYNNVWVPFSIDLHDFLDHPMLWLYDLFENEVDNYVETASRFLGNVLEKIITWSWENS